nr:unnamed protein product [Callosobruchus analis]
MSTKNKPPDIGDKKCEICDDFIRKGSARVKCNGQDCSVALHQKCFLAIAKIIKIDRDEWQCKGCIDESSSQAGGEAICQELAMMKEEVRLLKEMLAEVRLSNKLLIERLEKLPQVDNHTLNEKNSSLSYSEILSNIPRKQSTSVLIIKSKNGKDDNIDVMNTIKSNINPSSENIMIERTKLVKNGMLVTCCDGKSLEKLKTIVDKQFSNKFDSFVPKRFKPRLLVSDVDKSVESKEEFLNMLVQNNQYLSDKDIKVVSMIKLKFSLNVILEVEPEVRKHILSTGYILTSWQKCYVRDYVVVVRCFNCCRFGHFKKDCKSKTVCSICSGDHDFRQCQSRRNLCINCSASNNYMKKTFKKFTLLDTNHAAFDLKCPSFLKRCELLKSRIDYG